MKYINQNHGVFQAIEDDNNGLELTMYERDGVAVVVRVYSEDAPEFARRLTALLSRFDVFQATGTFEG